MNEMTTIDFGRDRFFQLTDGRWVCKARDLGRAQGYTDDGKKLVSKIRQWPEMREGVHFLIAKSSDLLIVADSATIPPRGCMVLTVDGVTRELMLTRQPIGAEFRDQLEVIVRELRETGTVSLRSRPLTQNRFESGHVPALTVHHQIALEEARARIANRAMAQETRREVKLIEAKAEAATPASPRSARVDDTVRLPRRAMRSPH